MTDKTNMPLPTIIRKAIPRELCDTVATELQGATFIGQKGPYNQYKLTQTCSKIAREADEVSINYALRMLALLSPVRPTDLA